MIITSVCAHTMPLHMFKFIFFQITIKQVLHNVCYLSANTCTLVFGFPWCDKRIFKPYHTVYFLIAKRVNANDQQQMRMMAFQNFMEQFKMATGPKVAQKGSSKGDISSTIGPTSHRSSRPKLVTRNILVRKKLSYYLHFITRFCTIFWGLWFFFLL